MYVVENVSIQPLFLSLMWHPPDPPIPPLAPAALKPSWAKAHQRMGAAFLALQLFSDAKEAYEKAAKLEPDNQVGS